MRAVAHVVIKFSKNENNYYKVFLLYHLPFINYLPIWVPPSWVACRSACLYYGIYRKSALNKNFKKIFSYYRNKNAKNVL
nr:MAG TPA: hypothetical protein [Caudoviricetes sp.]